MRERCWRQARPSNSRAGAAYAGNSRPCARRLWTFLPATNRQPEAAASYGGDGGQFQGGTFQVRREMESDVFFLELHLFHKIEAKLRLGGLDHFLPRVFWGRCPAVTATVWMPSSH